MILGCKTKDEAKAEAKAHNDIAANPALQKVYGVLDYISILQSENPRANEMPVNLLIPTPVVQFISQGVWKYDFTTTPAQPPVGWTGYVTTWVRVTKISWI